MLEGFTHITKGWRQLSDERTATETLRAADEAAIKFAKEEHRWNFCSSIRINEDKKIGFLAGSKWGIAHERERADALVKALEYYAAMRFNREKMEWMPAGPEHAQTALAVYSAAEEVMTTPEQTDQSRDEREKVEAYKFAEGKYPANLVIQDPLTYEERKRQQDACVVGFLERARRTSEPQGQRWEIWVNGEGQVVRDQRFAQPTDRKVIVCEVPKPQPPASEMCTECDGDGYIDNGDTYRKCQRCNRADDRSQASDKAFYDEAHKRYPLRSGESTGKVLNLRQAFVHGCLYSRHESEAAYTSAEYRFTQADNALELYRQRCAEQVAEIGRLKRLIEKAQGTLEGIAAEAKFANAGPYAQRMGLWARNLLVELETK